MSGLAAASAADAREALARAEALIRTIPDHPRAGIQFKDLTPLLADAASLRTVVDALVEPFAGEFDVVAGLEARGFLLAGAMAVRTGTGILTIRKAGRLPRPTASADYALEYGTATIEVHRDDVPAGTRVLFVDDVLATGGTLGAARRLGQELGWAEAGLAVVLELDDLGGRAALPGARVESLFHA